MTINRALAAMQFAQKQSPNRPADSADTTPTGTPPATDKNETPAFFSGSILGDDIKSTPTPAPIKAAESQKTSDIVRVDLSIAGTPHRISCPSSEVATVNKNADRLNDNLRDIRRSVGSKNPTNEELLVLHCLELYDQLHDLKRQLQDKNMNNERSQALLDKLIKDTQAMVRG